MTAADMLREVERYGGRLVRNGEGVRVTAPAPLPGELMQRLREHKADLLRLLPQQADAKLAAFPKDRQDVAAYGGLCANDAVTPFSGNETPKIANAGGVGEQDPTTPCPTCGSGSYWHGADGWHCEGCAPAPADVVRWCHVSGGKPAAVPAPALPWPADLNAMLRRVATAFEWTDTDRRDFVAWARRSAQGLADAREFLRAECAKLPAPGLEDRRREVLAMLADDPALRVAWTCADDGVSDPVLLTLAIRGKGSCELAIPRAKFDGLALPFLIGEFEQQRGDE